MNTKTKFERYNISMHPNMAARIDKLIGRASRSAWIQVAIEERLAREAPIEGEIPR